MDIQMHISDDVVQGRTQRELKKALSEGLLILDYLNARLSIGEMAEKLGMNLVDARDWLHGKGIATLRKMSPELEEVANENMERLIKSRTPSIPK